MAKKCNGNPTSERRTISGLTDKQIIWAVGEHARPGWWQEGPTQGSNQAYLRRYGSMLRREARKRGLM